MHLKWFVVYNNFTNFVDHHDSHHHFRLNAILASLKHWNLNVDYRIILCRRPPDFET